jgi:hypothetical protein
MAHVAFALVHVHRNLRLRCSRRLAGSRVRRLAGLPRRNLRRRLRGLGARLGDCECRRKRERSGRNQRFSNDKHGEILFVFQSGAASREKISDAIMEKSRPKLCQAMVIALKILQLDKWRMIAAFKLRSREAPIDFEVQNHVPLHERIAYFENACRFRRLRRDNKTAWTGPLNIRASVANRCLGLRE